MRKGIGVLSGIGLEPVPALRSEAPITKEFERRYFGIVGGSARVWLLSIFERGLNRLRAAVRLRFARGRRSGFAGPLLPEKTISGRQNADTREEHSSKIHVGSSQTRDAKSQILSAENLASRKRQGKTVPASKDLLWALSSFTLTCPVEEYGVA